MKKFLLLCLLALSPFFTVSCEMVIVEGGPSYSPYIQAGYRPLPPGGYNIYGGNYRRGGGVRPAGPGYPSHAVRDGYGIRLLIPPDQVRHPSYEGWLRSQGGL